MNTRDLYAAVAAVLLASLGLGVLYLLLLERITLAAAIGLLIVLGALVPLASALRDIGSDDRPDRR